MKNTANPTINGIKYVTHFRPFVQENSPTLKECQAHYSAELSLDSDNKTDQDALYRRVRFLASVGEEQGDIVRQGNALVCMSPEQKAAYEEAQREVQARIERMQGLLTAFGLTGKVGADSVSLPHESFENICQLVANASAPARGKKGKTKAA